MHVDHGCEAIVEKPMEEGQERPQLVKCRILALRQCSVCSKYLCGTEELEHLIVCVKCDAEFCPEHYAAHRLSRECEQMEEVA